MPLICRVFSALAICMIYVCCPAASWSQTFPTKPGSIFSDGTGLPVMVVIPSGSLAVATPSSGELRWHQLSTPPDPPPHQISLAHPFAMSKYPITIGEWDACVAARGCLAIPSQWPVDPRIGPDDPVTHVSFFDAQSYVAWLNKLTAKAGNGAPYAVPSGSCPAPWCRSCG